MGGGDLMAEADLPLDLRILQALLEAADVEACRQPMIGLRLQAVEALQMELWRQRRPLIAGVGASRREPLEALRPFARVAELLEPGAAGVLLSVRGRSARTDYVQLAGRDFFRAADLVFAHGANDA